MIDTNYEKARFARLAAVSLEGTQAIDATLVSSRRLLEKFDFFAGQPELWQTVCKFYRDEGSSNATELRELRDRLLDTLRVHAREEVRNAALESLSAQFGLTPTESAYVEFCYLGSSGSTLEDLFEGKRSPPKISLVARWCDCSEKTVYEIGGEHGSLHALGVLGFEDDAPRRWLFGEMSPVSFKLSLPIGKSLMSGGLVPLSSFLFRADTATPLAMAKFDIPPTTLSAARAILGAPGQHSSVLVYGEPGTGKTEFTRSLCKSLGSRACFLPQAAGGGGRSYSLLQLAVRMLDPDTEILVVDEAEDFLSDVMDFAGMFSNKAVKGSINALLDSATARMIFVCNRIDAIPASVLRRFSLHIAFGEQKPARRLELWKDLCGASELFTPAQLSSLSSHYKAGPARIRQVLDTCAKLVSDSGEDRAALFYNVAVDMLARSDEVLHGVPRTHRVSDVQFDPKFLSLSHDPDALLDSLRRWKQRRGQTGICLLFHGEPGTGKTAFAHHIAESLGLENVTKRASDLLGKYVGETESRIRSAFDEAEDDVLIFDEADSFLGDRSGARSHWERSMTNEILTCMDGFRGLFIATTNLCQSLDLACLRRFAFKIEFRPVAADLRCELVSSYFTGLNWDARALGRLADLRGLNPGDVATVAKRLAFHDNLDSALIVDELAAEVEGRKKHRGVVGFHTN